MTCREVLDECWFLFSAFSFPGGDGSVQATNLCLNSFQFLVKLRRALETKAPASLA